MTRMNLLLSLLMCVICIGRSHAQSNDDPYQKLRDRQAERTAARSKVISITQGEIDDLRARIAVLEAENVRLRQAALVTSRSRREDNQKTVMSVLEKCPVPLPFEKPLANDALRREVDNWLAKIGGQSVHDTFVVRDVGIGRGGLIYVLGHSGHIHLHCVFPRETKSSPPSSRWQRETP